jgi:hypothetical protein
MRISKKSSSRVVDIARCIVTLAKRREVGRTDEEFRAKVLAAFASSLVSGSWKFVVLWSDF